MRHVLFLALIIALSGGSALAQGPVTLMGIDGEDGNTGPGGAHGGTLPYISVLNDVNNNVTNGGTGILVIGAGKSAGDDVTLFWNAMGVGIGEPVTTVNGAGAIAAQSFAGFRIICVCSSFVQTPSGGLTNAENNALTPRAADVANHVNGGGGLFALAGTGLAVPYGYLGSVGAFTFNFPPQFSGVTATPAGMAVGITNTNMDVCCWHDEYITFPGFLNVLATNDNTGNACAIGGAAVVITQGIVLTPLMSTCLIGGSHTVTASVADSTGAPVVGTLVTFNVISGPHAGTSGSAITNAAGQASFTYAGNVNTGTDVIEACFIDAQQQMQCATATKEWIECMMMASFASANIPMGNDTLLLQPLWSAPMTLQNIPTLHIPDISTLVGVKVYVQAVLWNPVVFPNDPLKFSQGLEFEIGNAINYYGWGSGLGIWSTNLTPPGPGDTIDIGFSVPGF